MAIDPKSIKVERVAQIGGGQAPGFPPAPGSAIPNSLVMATLAADAWRLGKRGRFNIPLELYERDPKTVALIMGSCIVRETTTLDDDDGAVLQVEAACHHFKELEAGTPIPLYHIFVNDFGIAGAIPTNDDGSPIEKE